MKQRKKNRKPSLKKKAISKIREEKKVLISFRKFNAELFESTSELKNLLNYSFVDCNFSNKISLWDDSCFNKFSTQFDDYNNYTLEKYFICKDTISDKYAIDHFLPRFEEKLLKYITISDNFHTKIKNFNSHASRASTIQEISEELRKLRAEFRITPTKKSLIKIKDLVHQLNSLISFYYREQKKLVRRLQSIYFKKQCPDIRLRFRSIVRFLFKCLDDFSGCDEEALTNPIIVGKTFSINNQRNYVFKKRINFYNRLNFKFQ